MEKLTYKNFKIGQNVLCINLSENKDFYEKHLTIGKKYKIEDLDFHFPDKICVRSDNKKTSGFMPIKFFSDIKYMRKLKLEKIYKSTT